MYTSSTSNISLKIQSKIISSKKEEVQVIPYFFASIKAIKEKNNKSNIIRDQKTKKFSEKL